MLMQGQGEPQYQVEARRQLTLAAAHGNAEAQFNLGFMLDQGEGGPKDEVQARRLLGLAAAQGHENAVEMLAALEREAEERANVAAEALIAEEEVAKAKTSNPKKKGRKKLASDGQGGNGAISSAIQQPPTIEVRDAATSNAAFSLTCMPAYTHAPIHSRTHTLTRPHAPMYPCPR
jgi:TPR repeat protein